MASFYRPSNFAPSAGGDSLAGASKAGESAPASVSAKIETQLSNRADITAAHKFFQPSMDLGKAAVIPVGDAGAGAQAAHAASQQVSPLIQMIMKMPGHIGVLSSFFDALSAFFKPEHWFNLLDPHHLAQQAHASLSHSLSASEHLPINLSLLPHDAPIFSSLGSHADLSRGLTASTPVEMRLHDLNPGSKDYMNCSGTLDIKKPQFETGTQALAGKQIEPVISGPQVSNNISSSSLAGSHRLFSDRIDSVIGAHKPGLNASNNLAANTASQQATSSLNVSANPYGQSVEALPASSTAADALVSGPSLSQNVGYHLGAAGPTHLDAPSGYGPSGAVSDTLGGQHVLAMDTPSAQPNLSAMHSSEAQPILGNDAASLPASSSNSSLLSNSASAADPSASSIAGLKAKPLGLNAFKDKHAIAYDPVGYDVSGHGAAASAHANTHAMDQIAHRTKGGHHGGKAVDRIAHRTISHKVGDHVRPAVAADSQSIAAKPVLADHSLATRVDGLSANNAVSQPADGSISGGYSVKAGDNLWDIARKQLGSGSRWKEIYNLNSKVLGDNPSLIHVGTQLQLPGQDIAGSSAGTVAAAGEAQKYVVQSGDSLWKIAHDHLGGGQNWGQIYHVNQQVIGDNPRLIFPGQQLNIGDATQVASASSAANSTMSGMTAATPAINPVAMQPPAAFGRPNMPVSAPGVQHAVEAVADNGPGAVQAATTSTQAATHASPSFSIPKSLIPDLSFLKKKH